MEENNSLSKKLLDLNWDLLPKREGGRYSKQRLLSAFDYLVEYERDPTALDAVAYFLNREQTKRPIGLPDFGLCAYKDTKTLLAYEGLPLPNPILQGGRLYLKWLSTTE